MPSARQIACLRVDCNQLIWCYCAVHGRSPSDYYGMQTLFPVSGQHAPGPTSSQSAAQRLELMYLLLKEGCIPRGALIANAYGANALHVAAAAGNLAFVDAFLAADCSIMHPQTMWTAAVDTALLTQDCEGRTPVDVAAKMGNVMVAQRLGLGLLSNLSDVASLCHNALAQSSLPTSKRFHFKHNDPEVNEKSSSWSFVGGLVGWAEQGKVSLHDDAMLGELRRNETLLAARLAIPREEAAMLLEKHRFNVDDAFRAGRRKPVAGLALSGIGARFSGDADCIDDLHESGDIALKTQKGRGEKEKRKCSVCAQIVLGEEGADMCAYALEVCKHFVCDECLFWHVSARVTESSDVLQIACPSDVCSECISSSSAERILEAAPHALARFQQSQASPVSISNNIVNCPVAGCSAVVELPPHAASRAVAVSCGIHSFCFGCKALPHHEPSSCDVWAAFLKLQHVDEIGTSMNFAASKTRCRGCRAPMQRTLGCNHMRCAQCGSEFCCACGSAWDRSHYKCAHAWAHDEHTNSFTVLSRDSTQERQELIQWCQGGYLQWETIRRALPGEFWLDLRDISHGPHACVEVYDDARICDNGVIEMVNGPRKSPAVSRYWVDVQSGVDALQMAHSAMLVACRVMACSFAIDLAVQPGLRYVRARRLLRTLRGDLEVDLQPLSSLFNTSSLHGSAMPRRNLPGVGMDRDKSQVLALLYVLQTRPEIARAIVALGRRVQQRSAQLACAGRAGVLTAPSAGSANVVGMSLAQEGLIKAKQHARDLMADLSKSTLVTNLSQTVVWKTAANCVSLAAAFSPATGTPPVFSDSISLLPEPHDVESIPKPFPSNDQEGKKTDGSNIPRRFKGSLTAPRPFRSDMGDKKRAIMAMYSREDQLKGQTVPPQSELAVPADSPVRRIRSLNAPRSLRKSTMAEGEQDAEDDKDTPELRRAAQMVSLASPRVGMNDGENTEFEAADGALGRNGLTEGRVDANRTNLSQSESEGRKEGSERPKATESLSKEFPNAMATFDTGPDNELETIAHLQELTRRVKSALTTKHEDDTPRDLNQDVLEVDAAPYPFLWPRPQQGIGGTVLVSADGAWSLEYTRARLAQLRRQRQEKEEREKMKMGRRQGVDTDCGILNPVGEDSMHSLTADPTTTTTPRTWYDDAVATATSSQWQKEGGTGQERSMSGRNPKGYEDDPVLEAEQVDASAYPRATSSPLDCLPQWIPCTTCGEDMDSRWKTCPYCNRAEPATHDPLPHS